MICIRRRAVHGINHYVLIFQDLSLFKRKDRTLFIIIRRIRTAMIFVCFLKIIYYCLTIILNYLFAATISGIFRPYCVQFRIFSDHILNMLFWISACLRSLRRCSTRKNRLAYSVIFLLAIFFSSVCHLWNPVVLFSIFSIGMKIKLILLFFCQSQPVNNSLICCHKTEPFLYQNERFVQFGQWQRFFQFIVHFDHALTNLFFIIQKFG